MSTITQSSVWDELVKHIHNMPIDESERVKLLNNLVHLRKQKINMLITGATGCGKSSTINALFDQNVAKVGVGVDPETMNISRFELNNLILWDSPGLGDSPKQDERHSKNIINKLQEKDADGNALIDVVLVIIDGSSRDMGTSYTLINEVIIPNLREKDRIIVAINQCDIAMKGKGWNETTRQPEPELKQFLEEKSASVSKRIMESTSVTIDPICFSATEMYNLSKLLCSIVKHTPEEKRAVYIADISRKKEVWESNDDQQDYNKEVGRDIKVSLTSRIASATAGGAAGRAAGAAVGSIFGPAGTAIGATVGTLLGTVIGFFWD